MENKILVEIFIPAIDKSLDLYIPLNKRIGNIIMLINKALLEIDESYALPNSMVLYNRYTSKSYGPNELVATTDITSGSSLILV